MRVRLALAVIAVASCGAHPSPLAPIVAGGVPSALMLVRDGDDASTVLAHVHDAGVRFRVGSVTKTFVATVVLQLVAERRLALEEAVAGRLPGLLPDGDRITVRDLLAHRSGLPDVADDPAVVAGTRSSWPAAQLVRSIAREPRTNAPGAAFHYSSTNYLVLGMLVERVTGNGIGAELRRRIIEPLVLHDTAYVPGAIRGPHLHGYSLPAHQGVVDPSAEPRDLEAESARWAGASGDLVSSAGDVARFFRALLRGRLVPQPLLRQMEDVRDRYGLGLAVRPTPCGLAWGHTGNLNGVLTVAWNTRDARRQVVLVANEYPLTAAADSAINRAATDAFCG